MAKMYMLLLVGCSLHLNGADPDPMDGIKEIETALFRACKAGGARIPGDNRAERPVIRGRKAHRGRLIDG